MSKSLFALPFVALALIAAKPAPAPVAAAPAFNINPPAEIAADPANHLKIELSSGGTVEVLLRPDLAPCGRRAQSPSRSAVARSVPAFSSVSRPRLDGGEHGGKLKASRVSRISRGS